MGRIQNNPNIVGTTEGNDRWENAPGSRAGCK
jgi:hypothetical protein